jgi:hypothetical protein
LTTVSIWATVAGEMGRLRSSGRRAPAVALTAAACVLALPSAAGASTASLTDGVLRVTGTPGVDELTLYADGPDLIVRDGFVPTTAGPGCVLTPNAFAACPLAVITRVEADLGAGDDVLITRAPRPATIHGGPGDDTLIAGAAPVGVTLDGGPGDDHLVGSPHADVLLGGPGADGLDGAFGDDLLDGGPGRDAYADPLGNDTINAADGEPDFVDCGPGTDHGTFDPFDTTLACEGAPTTPPTDCTPEIAPPTPADTRRLLAGRALRLDLTVAPGCSARATLLIAGVPYAAAASSTETRGITLRPSRAGLRALRRHRTATIRVVSRGTATSGPTAVTRRIPLRVA